MPEPMEIDQVIFERLPLDDNGDLYVAINSRRLMVECLERDLQIDPNPEQQETLRINRLLLEAGHDEFVCDEDYYYDVVDGFNMIARYSGRECVVGRRIMTWVEFRASTTRSETHEFLSFAEFRDEMRRRREAGYQD